MITPAPYLTGKGCCSECGVHYVLGNGDLKICPKCFALLWHPDYTAAERHARRVAEAATAAMREEAKRVREEIKAKTENTEKNQWPM